MLKLIQQKPKGLFYQAESKSTAGVDKEKLGLVLFEYMENMTPEEIARLLINPVSALFEYIKLCRGHRAGKNISLLFNPHRLEIFVKGSSSSLADAVKKGAFHKGLARALLHKLETGVASAAAFDQALAFFVNGVQLALDFQPIAARKILLRYGLTENSSVLDPCAGWGGRMIGASTVVNHYSAFEASNKTVIGLKKCASFLSSLRPEFSASIEHCAFEEAQLAKQTFDFAFTSPPYFDTEEYGGELDSAKKFPTFDLWASGFFEPLIVKTIAALKPGAAFVINIGDRRYPLSGVLFSICERAHFLCKKLPILYLGGGGGLNRQTTEGEKFYEIRCK